MTYVDSSTPLPFLYIKMSEVEIINLIDTDGEILIDSVSGEYEDSFCLETFSDLARAHESSDPAGTKSFIIARVQTWDPKQPEKVMVVDSRHFIATTMLTISTRYYFKRKTI
jgi:hypothetical protein